MHCATQYKRLPFPRSTAIQLKEIALMFDYVGRAKFNTKHASFVGKILRICTLYAWVFFYTAVGIQNFATLYSENETWW